jgi:hypothetical protein
MEELIDNKKEDITIELEDDSSSSSSSSSSVFAKSIEKISYIVLLSAAWAAKTKSGVKTGYFDCRNGLAFIVKWLESLTEVAGEVTKDNMYECIIYTIENKPNFVPVLGLNWARFDMNILDILHNPPHWYTEFIIGNLNYFKMVTVKTFDGLCLKFLDAMNYAPSQTLDSFVKTFGNVNGFPKGVFAYDGFNSNNYMEVLNKSEPFTQVDFHSTLRDSDISDKDYEAYLVDWKEKMLTNRWEYLKFYNVLKS